MLDLNPDLFSFLQSQSIPVVEEIVLITCQYLSSGMKHKQYCSAASKLGLEIQSIEKVIENLAKMFLDVVKLKATQEDFLNNYQDILDVTKLNLIWIGIQNEFDYLEEVLSKLKVDHLKFTSFDWRLEYLLATRSSQNHKEILTTASLKLNKDGYLHNQVFTMDLANLNHLTDVLNMALKETKKKLLLC